jgi:tetratricopeptide (TPR) repeat protein
MIEEVFLSAKEQTRIISNFYTNVADKIIEIGKDYKTCFKVLQAYLDFVLKNIGEETQIASQAYGFFAEKYLEKNKYKEAVVHAERALDIQKKLKNENGQILALNLLASIYLKIGDLELVKEFLSQVTNLLLVCKNDELENLHKQNLANFHAYYFAHVSAPKK